MLHFKTILYATDFSQRSQPAFGLACSLAFDHGAKLVVVHAVPPPAVAFGEALTQRVYEEALEHARRDLEKLRPTDPAVHFETRVMEGDPAAVILEAAREAGAELIVLGTHGRAGLSRVIMGSVAEEVLRKAHCPVVVMKAEQAKTEAASQPFRVHAKT
ncbi:MAG: universal stress protein [Gemmataceae bacterium]